ncbi:queuosine precursor transporter [Desulfotignum balticum]|uniref:queuosine precursor transporter n=1 Tax=Desulfotignum balticum TaxID=115781 RepID=UPI0004246E88|nr:queuosine precursor transporter [Desulfotignum balticum]
MNELLWLAMLAVNFGFILFSYKIFGRPGLYAWVPLAAIVSNIQVIKLVELFGITATLGNIVYASSFLVTDILSEIYGKKQAKKAVFIGLFSLVAMTVLMNLALWFTPAPDDFAQDSLANIFGFMPRIAAASLLAYLVSQMHDVWAYDFWRRRFPGLRRIWLRNNASTMVSQFIDSTVFTVLAFWGVFPPAVLVQIFWTTYLLKWVVGVADTPFIYLARHWFDQGKIPGADTGA